MFRWFEGLVDPYTSYEETDQLPKQLYPFLRHFLAPFRAVFVVSILMSFVSATIEIGLFYYMGRLVDILAETDPAAFWRERGAEMILIVLLLICVRPLTQLLHVLLLNNTLMPNVGTLVRWRAHRQVLRQSVGWFENDFAGRIANRIMQTPPAVGEVVYQVFDAIAFAIAYLIGMFILLSSADLLLLFPLLMWIIPYLILLRWVIKRIRPASEAASDARSAVTGRVVDSYTNIHSVKMFAHHDKEVNYAKEAIEKARSTFQIEMRLYTIMDAVLILLNGLLVVGVVGIAIWSWSKGETTIGVVAVAVAITLRMEGMSHWIMWSLSNFFRELGIVQEGMNTIADPITLKDHSTTVISVSRGEVVINGLTHSYGRDQGGLQNIDLTIPAGQKVGLVGRSGAGKSTLIKLLLRFYDAEAGKVLIDGQDIMNVTQASLRSSVGMVQQDSALLHRSVRENINYGKPDATDEEMIAAAKQAQAHDFILELEDSEGRKGYDARVGERGVKLSGGQRQRISLARVILKDAPILMLDEATSALDSEVEAAIQSTLRGMMEGKTVIAIAHRLSTIAHMDRIIVLDDGQIVEDGTHDSLLAENGLYATFWARQSGGFLGHDRGDK